MRNDDDTVELKKLVALQMESTHFDPEVRNGGCEETKSKDCLRTLNRLV